MGSAVESTEWVHLTGDESVLWAGTPSMYPAIPVMALGFALSFLSVWLFRAVELPVVPGWLSLTLLPVGLLIGAWAYLSRWSTRYVFTTKAVYEKTGLFSRTVTQVRFDRVGNTALDQSWIERALSYGDIELYTAGSGGVDLFLRDVPDPGRANAIVTARLGDPPVESRETPSTDERPTV